MIITSGYNFILTGYNFPQMDVEVFHSCNSAGRQPVARSTRWSCLGRCSSKAALQSVRWENVTWTLALQPVFWWSNHWFLKYLINPMSFAKSCVTQMTRNALSTTCGFVAILILMSWNALIDAFDFWLFLCSRTITRGKYALRSMKAWASSGTSRA